MARSGLSLSRPETISCFAQPLAWPLVLLTRRAMKGPRKDGLWLMDALPRFHRHPRAAQKTLGNVRPKYDVATSQLEIATSDNTPSSSWSVATSGNALIELVFGVLVGPSPKCRPVDHTVDWQQDSVPLCVHHRHFSLFAGLCLLCNRNSILHAFNWVYDAPHESTDLASLPLNLKHTSNCPTFPCRTTPHHVPPSSPAPPNTETPSNPAHHPYPAT